MLKNKKIAVLSICLIAVILLAFFSGCNNGNTTPPPKTIKITVSDITLADLPAFTTMAGFTVSLIAPSASLSIDWNVGFYAQKTVLIGITAEAIKAFLTNPPSAPVFSLDFNVQLSSEFDGTGDYAVAFGVSNAYNKYVGQTATSTGPYTALYPEGKMFITKDTANPTVKGTCAISNGMVIPWSNFLKNTDGKGYSAVDIVAMF